MTVARRPTARLVIATVAAMLLLAVSPAASWRGPDEAQATSPAPTDDEAARCELPDLVGMEPAVRRQLEEAAARTRSGAAEAPAARARGAAEGTLARHLHAYGLLPAAERCYRAAERLAPDQPEWPHLLGIVLEERGRTADARHAYGRALALARSTHSLVRLAELERTAGALDTAERLFLEVLDRQPGEAASLAGLGQIALSRRDYKRAVEHLSAALETAPAADALHVPLALAYRGLGRQEQVRRHLAQRGAVGVTVADPELAAVEALRAGEVPNLLRGRQAFAAGDYAAAAEAFADAVAAAPESVRARLNLAAALGEAGRVDEALDQLDAVLALAPGHAGAHFNRGILLVRGGRDDDAIEALRQAVRLDPSDSEAPLQAAAALTRLGRVDEALTLYEKVIRAHPERPEGWLGTAELLLRGGDVAAARARLEEARRALPNSTEVAAALERLRARPPR